MASDPHNCKHERSTIRKRIASNGVSMFKSQCDACGAGVGQWIRAKDVPEIWRVENWDEALEAAGHEAARSVWEQESAKRREEAEQQSAEFWQWYDDYLQTDKWRIKRAAVLRRDDGQCQACLSRPATQVHHLTYAHVGDEPLFELVGICKPCHDRLTQMDREARPQREAI